MHSGKMRPIPVSVWEKSIQNEAGIDGCAESDCSRTATSCKDCKKITVIIKGKSANCFRGVTTTPLGRFAEIHWLFIMIFAAESILTRRDEKIMQRRKAAIAKRPSGRT